MKTFSEHANEQEQLQEGVIRTGAIATYGARSRKEGDASVRAFKQGQQTLRKGSVDVNIEDRLKRIEQSLDALLDGLIKMRHQLGASVAVDVVGHSLAAKDRKRG